MSVVETFADALRGSAPIAPPVWTVAGKRPESASAWSNVAWILARTNDLDNALHAADRAIALDPLFPNAWSNRALVQLRRGEHALAISDATQSIAVHSQDADPWAIRGLARTALHDAGAASDIEKALAIGDLGHLDAETRAALAAIHPPLPPQNPPKSAT